MIFSIFCSRCVSTDKKETSIMPLDISFHFTIGLTVVLLLLALNRGVSADTLLSVQLGGGSGTTNHRWMDVANHVYAESYQQSYNYTLASVTAQYYTDAAMLYGTLTATNLKPNFAYQLKLVGSSADPAAKETIGLTGRWWQMQWNGSSWVNGQNLNNKGDGSSPNPNDVLYYARRDVADPSSPTGKKYSYTSYRLLDYFVTDANGNATLNFCADDSYHVLWKTTQRSPQSGDGPVRSRTFDVTQPGPLDAYDTTYPTTTTNIFGEWERLPAGGIGLPAGDYMVGINITEESFHGGGLEGYWASAMGATLNFTIVPEPAMWRLMAFLSIFTALAILLGSKRGRDSLLARQARVTPGGLVYHVLNRLVAGLPLFRKAFRTFVYNTP